MPKSLSDLIVYLRDSLLKYSCKAEVITCGLCFIFLKPKLRLKVEHSFDNEYEKVKKIK